jgi:hypothetical protein
MLFAAADTLRQQIGAPFPPINRERVANGIALSRMALDSARFEAAWAYGETQARVGLQQVVTMALDDS